MTTHAIDPKTFQGLIDLLGQHPELTAGRVSQLMEESKQRLLPDDLLKLTRAGLMSVDEARAHLRLPPLPPVTPLPRPGRWARFCEALGQPTVAQAITVYAKSR